MKAVKATYENGRVILSESPPAAGPIEVLVVFPEQTDDPWERILTDGSDRPELSKWIAEVKTEIAQGKARPLSVDDL
jgi:hypothetical protein